MAFATLASGMEVRGVLLYRKLRPCFFFFLFISDFVCAGLRPEHEHLKQRRFFLCHLPSQNRKTIFILLKQSAHEAVIVVIVCVLSVKLDQGYDKQKAADFVVIS